MPDMFMYMYQVMIYAHHDGNLYVQLLYAMYSDLCGGPDHTP